MSTDYTLRDYFSIDKVQTDSYKKSIIPFLMYKLCSVYMIAISAD